MKLKLIYFLCFSAVFLKLYIFGNLYNTAIHRNGQFFGIFYNTQDNLSYISYIKQAEKGFYMFSDLYTSDENIRGLINPLFLLIGKFCGLFHSDPALTLMFIGVLAGVLPMLAIYGISGMLYPEKKAEFTLAVSFLMFFGSGVSWIFLKYKMFKEPGIDLSYFDLFGYSNYIVYPFHCTISLIISLLTFLMFKTVKQASLNNIFLLTAASLFLFFSRPYEYPIIFASYLLFSLYENLLKKRNISELFSASFDSLTAVLILGSAYYYWFSLQDVWKNLGSISANISVSRTSWILGTGVFFLLSCVSLVRRFIDRNLNFFSFYFILFILLNLIFNIRNSKLSGSFVFFLSFSASEGFFIIYESIRTLKRKYFRTAAFAVLYAFFLSASINFFTAVKLLEYAVPLMDKNLYSLLKKIDTENESRTILSYSNLNEFIPAFTGMKVYSGHWSLTNNFREKNQQIDSLLKDGLKEIQKQDTLLKFLKESRIQHILLEKKHFTEMGDHLLKIYESGNWVFAKTRQN